MSSSFKLLSHPDRTLQTHLDNCFKVGAKVLEQKIISGELLPKKEIEQLFKQLVYFHDFGKSTDFFQHKIIEATKRAASDFTEENENYIEDFDQNKQANVLKLLEDDDRLGNHSLLGAYYQLTNSKRDDEIEELILFKIIQKHHGNLTNFHLSKESVDQFHLSENKLKRLETQLDHLPFNLYQNILPDEFWAKKEDWEVVKKRFLDVLLGNDAARKLKKAKSLRYFFLQHYMYSLLLSADKGDVKIKNKTIVESTYVFPQNIVDKFKEIEFGGKEKKPIDEVREAAYQDIAKNIEAHKNENFFSITLPTGMGKTFSAYNAAILLQNLAEGTPRIVYCLPFTSIIDQNVKVLSDIFDKNDQDTSRISKNHHLSSLNSKFHKYEIDEQESEYLTDGWEHDFIVTTFVQLTDGIFSNKNKLLRKFHNVTDSIIILDEVQNIPPKYYEAIECTFEKMAEYFDTKFLFVTATQPLMMPNTNVIELTDPTLAKTRAYFENLERIELDKSLLNDGVNEDIDDWIELFKQDIDRNSDKSFLFILNTVASSQKVFNRLKEEYQANDCKVYYLSSSVLPCFRKLIIEKIKNEKGRKIVVSTQVVEAGVDIDLDVVYRDFAPLDSINQSAGRCNRNGINGKGTVKLFDTGKSKAIYDSTLRDITKNILADYPDVIQESELYELNQAYFRGVKKRIQDDNDTSVKIIDCMEKLLLEDLNEEFKLIDKAYPTYNVFIPFDKKDVTHLKDFEFPTKKSPKGIWSEYIELCQIENRFERKQAIKKLRPDLMQYVTKLPKSKYKPPEGKEENFLIYDLTWKSSYDLEEGVKTPTDFLG